MSEEQSSRESKSARKLHSPPVQYMYCCMHVNSHTQMSVLKFESQEELISMRVLASLQVASQKGTAARAVR